MKRLVQLFFAATMWLGLGSSNAQAQDAHWVELFGTTVSLQAADTDADGIFDLRERFLRTAPDESDTDGDGFSDLFEDSYRRFGFDPLFFTEDTDSDGLSDEYEASHGPDIDSVDTDGDGWSDFDEVMNAPFGYDPLVPTEDYDFDGVADELEIMLGLSPDTPDTNGDGVNDFQVVQAGVDREESYPDGVGEIIGTTYSRAMERALLAIRRGRDFPSKLAAQLPYPAVTTRLYGDPSTKLPGDGDGSLSPQPEPPPSVPLRVSSALLQQSVQNRPYPSYNEIVAELAQIADHYDGTPGPEIARLFHWSEPTNGGRFIYALKISDNPHFNESESEVLFMGLHHGKELVAASIPLALIRRITIRYEAGNRAMVRTVNRKEIWIIPVVNPDGYSMAIGELGEGANVAWRKNTRLVAEEWGEQSAANAGVDPNRNYGFEHVRSFSQSEWSNLTDPEVNGFRDSVGSGISPVSDTYAGEAAFTDVESQAVRGLANNEFGPGNSEIHGVSCSLSWHTRGGLIIHPMNHPTSNGLSSADVPEFARLSGVVAQETGYRDTRDSWWLEASGYAVYGTSDDWLYKEKGVLAITVEAYSAEERNNEGPEYFPVRGPKRSQVIRNNVRGAQRFMCNCGGPCQAVIQPLP
jgi:hypothetical protein